jgi:hypothetical protein
MREVLNQVRIRLDEVGPDGNEYGMEGQWRNTQLRRWVNEGMRDLARKTHYLMGTKTITLTASTAEYTVDSAVLGIYHAFYVPGDGRRVPLTPRPFNALDQIWGDSQNTHIGEPAIYTTLGMSPVMKIRFYPVPSVTSTTVDLRCSLLPTEKNVTGTGDTDALELPEAWVDVVVDYCEYNALRKDQQQRWMEAKALYDEKVANMAVAIEGATIAQEMVFDGTYPVPGWIADPGYTW